LINWKCKKWTT